MGIEARKQREKIEMREIILKSAMQLFLEEGIENVSLRKIAEKIEYSPAAIYSYFKDKGEIVHALHNEGFEKLYLMQRSLDDMKDPLKKLAEMGRIYMKFALENRDYYDLMFIAKGIGIKISEDKEWNFGERSYNYLRDNIKDCIEQGLFIKSDIDSVTFAFWSLVHGMASLIIRRRCAMIPEEGINNMISEGLRFMYESTKLKSNINPN